MEGDTKHVGLTDAQLAAVKDGVDPVLLQQGRDHVEEEKTVSVVQALKDHYPAAWWSVLLSCALIMEGYDLNIVSEIPVTVLDNLSFLIILEVHSFFFSLLLFWFVCFFFFSFLPVMGILGSTQFHQTIWYSSTEWNLRRQCKLDK